MGRERRKHPRLKFEVPVAGQAFRNLDATISQSGQVLSELGSFGGLFRNTSEAPLTTTVPKT